MGDTCDETNNFLVLKGALCNIYYVVVVNIDGISLILHKINIPFQILNFTLGREMSTQIPNSQSQIPKIGVKL